MSDKDLDSVPAAVLGRTLQTADARLQGILDQLELHLRRQDEPELLLLKGHLVLEQVINELLRVHMPRDGELERLNLTFSKKLDLLQALGHGFPRFGTCSIESVRELNRIRNRLAHHLDFSPSEQDLKRWACTVLNYTPKTLNRKSTYTSMVRRAFYFVVAFLTGAAITRHAIARTER